MINKKKLLEEIIEILSLDIDNLSKAARVAHADATNEESKAENKYDTRGLEASYLAGAQAKMAFEAAQNLACYKNLELKEFSNKSRVSLTAIVELEAEDGSRSFYFIGPKSGGVEINHSGTKVFLITPSSPLGQKLIGREVGDSVKVAAAGVKKIYEVVELY